MTRVGVIADTHCPELADEIPVRVFQLLAGVDLILHAGDVTSEATLARLRQIAPVEAVRGDHDRGLKRLPKTKVVTVEGKRVAMVHGNRGHLIEEPVTLIWTLTLGHLWLLKGLDRWLLGRFPDADVIVYGHTHRPLVKRYGRTLLFNPGGVYQITQDTCRERLRRHPGWFEWCWLQFARHIRFETHPTVGILEVTPTSVTAHIHDL